MSTSKLQVAIVGLGRMGSRHATHFHHLTPRADLVAACSPEPKELEWAARNLEGVRLYSDYDEMLNKEAATLQAVVVASATAVHAEHSIKAISRGLHVLCEKPLSTDIATVSAAKQNTSDLINPFSFTNRGGENLYGVDN